MKQGEVLEINKTGRSIILERGVRSQMVGVHEPRPENTFCISVEWGEARVWCSGRGVTCMAVSLIKLD